MSTLPLGWAQAQLGDLATYLNGAAFKPEDWSNEGTPIIRIQNLTDSSKRFNRTKRVVADKYLVKPGDLLVSWSATLDAFVWQGENGWLNQHIFKVIPFEGIDQRFLYYLLKYEIANLIDTEHLHGSTMKHINRGPFLTHEISLPPANEQNRIAAKLDEIFTRTRAARGELVHVPSLIENYKRAILDWEFSSERISGWPTSKIESILHEALIGLTRSKARQKHTGEVPYIRMNHFDMWGRWNQEDLTYVDVTEREKERYELHGGDILFNTRNSAELVGKVGIWPNNTPGYVYNNNILRLRFNEDVYPRFAFFYMISPWFRRYLENVKSATTSVAAIYQRNIYTAPFPVPALEEQKQIVERIDRAMEMASILRDELNKAYYLLEHLDQGMLAKAFRGELVAQNPDEEPADKLLERIRAAQTVQPKARRGRKKTSATG